MRTTKLAENSVPPCSDVWTVGETLPDPYDGCSKDGQTVEPVWHDCDDGSRYAEWNRGEAYAKEGASKSRRTS